MKRDLEKSWAERLRRKCPSAAALDGIEQYQRFGAPAAVLRASEGEDVDAAFPGHFRRRRIRDVARALAKRAPSMCSGRLEAFFATSERAAISSRRIGRAGFGRLGDGNRPSAARHARNPPWEAAGWPRQVHPARSPACRRGRRSGHQLGAGARRIPAHCIHPTFTWASRWQKHLAAGAIEAGERQRIGRRARADEEDRDVAFENLGKASFPHFLSRSLVP